MWLCCNILFCLFVCFRFMNRRASANCRYQPTCYEHAANCYTHAVSGFYLSINVEEIKLLIDALFVNDSVICRPCSSSLCRPSWAWRYCTVCRTTAGRRSQPGCTAWASVPSSWSPLCFISSPGRRATWGQEKQNDDRTHMTSQNLLISEFDSVLSSCITKPWSSLSVLFLKSCLNI